MNFTNWIGAIRNHRDVKPTSEEFTSFAILFYGFDTEPASPKARCDVTALESVPRQAPKAIGETTSKAPDCARRARKPGSFASIATASHGHGPALTMSPSAAATTSIAERAPHGLVMTATGPWGSGATSIKSNAINNKNIRAPT